jgi:hypothetical protein
MKWIRNNEALRASGDREAIAIYNEYSGLAMNVFENLSREDIKAIIAYFKEYPCNTPTLAANPTPAP